MLTIFKIEKRTPSIYFFFRERVFLLTGIESNSMRSGGGVINTFETDPDILLDINSPVIFCLKGFSAAWILPPVLQAKLDIIRCDSEVHFGHKGVQFASLNESLNSNSVLHLEQMNSYIGIASSFFLPIRF